MGLLQPLALLFGLSLPALLILYLLKVRRRPRRVGSTWLWRETVEDARASVPFQKLRRNLLMFLQLLILALLAIALARPIFNMAVRESGSVLIVIDTSASMAMRSEAKGPTRLEEAREKAMRLIQAMPKDSRAAVVEYANRASVLVPFTSDEVKLRQGLDRLEVKATSGNLEDAITLASSLIGNSNNPRIVVFSDSAQMSEQLMEAVGSTPVTIEACGTEAPNFGWTAMDLRRRSLTSDVYDFFGQVIGYGPDREVTIEVTAGDNILGVQRARLFSGSEVGVLIEGLELGGHPIIRSTIRAENEDFDALGLDNEIWTRVGADEKIKILFCSPGNVFLDHALSSIGGVELIRTAPGQPAPPENYDLAVYDRGLPAEPPDVPALYIAVSPWDSADEDSVDEDSADVDSAQSVETPVGAITNWDVDHPVTRLIQWSTVTVFGAYPTEPPPGARALVESGDLPLLILGRVGNQIALYLTFDLFRSNLPLRQAFPIFIKNTLDWMTHNRRGPALQSLNGGETFSTSVPDGVGRVTIISPEQKSWELKPGPGGQISFAETFVPGLWSVEYDGKVAHQFGVNLMNAEESDPALISSASVDAAGAISDVGLGSELRTNREIWRWLIAGALAILMLEWAFYQRRIVA